MAWLAPLLLPLVLGFNEGQPQDLGPDEGQCLLQTFLERHGGDLALAGTEEAGGHYCAQSSRSGAVCCGAECGECGGDGCGRRPGGGGQCCWSPINQEGRACTGTDDTVCVMPRGTYPGSKCRVNGQYNSMQAPVKNCKSDAFPVGSHFCLHGERFTVAASWNTGSSGATVNIEGNWPNGDFFTDDDEITPGC